MYGWGNNEYGQLSIKSHDMQVYTHDVIIFNSVT